MMKTSKIFKDALAATPEDVRIQVDLSMDISDRIAHLLDMRGMSQKEFARMMGKTEAEVSRWVGGTHNFTLSTIAKISAALGTSIIRVSDQYPDFETDRYVYKVAEDVTSFK